MGDKANVSLEKFKKLQVETTVSRKTIVKKYKNHSKSVKRKNRKRRSKRAYINMLKKERILRETQELCDSIQEFNVVDVGMKPMGNLNSLPQEVTEWQKQDPIAYWKSRAISLEIENKMLRQHLRNVYAQQLEYYEKSNDWQEVPNAENMYSLQQNDKDLSLEGNKIEKSYSKKKKDKMDIPSTSKGAIVSEKKKEIVKVLPREPEGKNRLQEMEKIYGEKAQKIMGMETAIELNYKRGLEDGPSPVYWPNIPLKL